MIRKKLLKNAATSLQAFLATLNTTQEACECCGMRKADNLLEFRTGQETEAMIAKLLRWIESDNSVKVRESESVSLRE